MEYLYYGVAILVPVVLAGWWVSQLSYKLGVVVTQQTMYNSIQVEMNKNLGGKIDRLENWALSHQQVHNKNGQ